MKLPAQFRWDRLSGRERLILASVVVVVIGTIGLQLHSMQQKRLADLRGQLQAVKDEIAALTGELPVKQRDVEQANTQQAEAKEREKLVAHTQQQLVESKGFAALMNEIFQVAREEDIEVMAVKPGEIKDRGNYLELPITIEVKSKFLALGEYIHKLEHLSNQLVVIGGVRIETNAQMSPLLKVGLQAVSFTGKT
jgi:Tfp pilus assembly protein PilO